VAKRGVKPGLAAKMKPAPIGAGLWEGFEVPKDLAPPVLSEFNRLVTNLRRVGTLERTDPQLVVSAARNQAMLEAAYTTVADEGMTKVGGHGGPIPHPLLATINQLTIRLRGQHADMGLTAGTARLGAGNKGDDGDGKQDEDWGDLLSITG
jgi:P27 family predicted phage terminase small subunit